jgi:transcriptional regulator with XRE-family HTH domain
MNMVTMKRFDHWALVHAMDDAEMDAQDLADEIGCSVEAVARWMAGIAEPKTGYANQAARALNVDIRKLYE